MNSSTTLFIRGMMAMSLVAFSLAVLPACETARTGDDLIEEPELDLQSSARQIYAGEIVTVIANSKNMVGQASEVRWTTTGGELDEENNGRVARVQFDRPGTYVISAQLHGDGELVATDSVTVEVRPLR